MSWKFPTGFLGANQEQQQQQQHIPTDSWYTSSVVGSSPNSSRPVTPSRGPDQLQSSSRMMTPSPTEAAGVIAQLKDKSVDELRKLLHDQDEYKAFFESLDQVKNQKNIRDDLRKVTLQLARENLEKEPRIMELRNQCTIIRTTELAAAQEKLLELEKQKEETLSFYSPASMLEKLQVAIEAADKESEALHQKFVEGEIDLPTFIQRYKKIRQVYHRRALVHLAAKTSM